MAFRLGALFPRVVLAVLVFLLATATLTFAAAKQITARQAAAPVRVAPSILVVPDVKGQAYVFAKGVLQDAGFAWRVGAGAQGYAAYHVASQSPAAGVRVLDTGAPTIVLRLERVAKYTEKGHTPENGSPYDGTAIRLADQATAPAAPKAKPATRPARKPTVKPKRNQPKKKVASHAPAARPPAFVVPGAKKEPLDEIPLTVRASRLAAWIAAHPSKTPANVRHWLYQHAWIVAGARLGWWRGAEALRTLIAVDNRVEAKWGVGARSEAQARLALAFVEARSR